MPKLTNFPTRKYHEFEYAKVTSIDYGTGEIGISTRHSIKAKARYVHEISDLSVGDTVLVDKVSNQWVIYEKVVNTTPNQGQILATGG